MKKKKNASRTIISLILSFFLALLFTAILICVSFSAGLCNVEIFSHSVSDSDYYDTLYEKLNGNLEELLVQAKLPKSVGEGVLSRSQVYVDGKVYVNSVLEGKQPKIETSEIEEKLQLNIETYLEEKEISAKQVKQGVDEIIDTVIIDYKNSLEFKLVDYFKEYRNLYSTWVIRILIFSFILSAVDIFLLLCIHPRKHRAVRYVTYAALAATISNFIYTYYCVRSIQSWDVLKSGSDYSRMVEEYLRVGISQGYYISLIGAVLFLVLLTVTKLLKKQGHSRG